MENWIIGHDLKTGTSHLESNKPCQDNLSSKSSKNKQWKAICISDGAGSAKYSEKSSKLVSHLFVDSLISLANKIDKDGPGSWVNDFITREILNIRESLHKEFQVNDLSDYHCTLVGLLLSENASLAIHIGDGAIIAGKFGNSWDNLIPINEKILASFPENGEFKNQTFFMTENHWSKHIRVTFLGQIDWFLMGSDGGLEVYCNDDELDQKLLSDTLSEMLGENTGSVISDVINGKIAKERTTDDISCAIGLKVSSAQKELSFYWDEKLEPIVNLDPVKAKIRAEFLKREKIKKEKIDKEKLAEEVRRSKVIKVNNSITEQNFPQKSKVDEFIATIMTHKRQILRIYLPALVGIIVLTLCALFYNYLSTEIKKLETEIGKLETEIGKRETEIKKLKDQGKKTRKILYKRLDVIGALNKELDEMRAEDKEP